MSFGSVLLATSLLVGTFAQGSSDQGYMDRMSKWRAQQETDLKAEEGWLSVAGLSWLAEGDNTIGSDPSCKVVLPSSAPAALGVLTLKDGVVTLAVASGANVTVDGKPASTVEMKSDASGSPVKAKIGSITFMIIQRGKRIGVRMFDDNYPVRLHFTGLNWYPVKPSYVIKAKYVAYDTTRQISITNVLGDISMNANPGYVEFTLDGKPCRLEAQAEDNGLFFNFADTTSGVTTYAAGRFLDAPKPENGVVVLDFNQATNPPCAFTTFATCPLPPKGNRLSVAVKAGEKIYHVH